MANKSEDNRLKFEINEQETYNSLPFFPASIISKWFSYHEKTEFCSVIGHKLRTMKMWSARKLYNNTLLKKQSTFINYRIFIFQSDLKISRSVSCAFSSARFNTRNNQDARMQHVLAWSHLLPSTHVKISQLVNKMCSQQACSKLVNKL
jgi:hypothetical protein